MSSGLKRSAFLVTLSVLGLIILPSEALAQETEPDPEAAEQSGQATTTTAADVLADAELLYGPPPPVVDCPDDDATTISGEIVVCRKRADNSQYLTQSREDAQNDYARRTMDAGDPRAPDVAGAGIFKGPATVSGLCVIPPCPPPPAIFIDVEALPEAPPGSDADRIARGLPPLGNDGLDRPQQPVAETATGSASPAEPQ